MLRYSVLGPLEVIDGSSVAALGPPKQRALLAILLLHVGERVATDRLVDLLWPERAPRTAAHSVQIYVSALRRSLGPLAGRDVIRTHHSAYQLDVDPRTIDASRFERLVTDGSVALGRGDVPGATVALRAALDLWRGPALSDFADEAFARPHIDRLTALNLDATERLATAELSTGQLQRVLALVQATVRADPFRERSRELLMLALYRSGRHPEALRQFQRYRELLAEELGLDPSPRLQRLQERILLHDPSLGPASPAPVVARNPYKGLRPFAEADAGDFFGRDALTAQLLDRLRSGIRLVALVGPSGSGKSSVVAAGVVPALRSDAVPGSSDWTITTVVPAGTSAEPEQLMTVEGGKHLLLIVDQFEELFALADGGLRRRFLDAIIEAVTDAERGVTVILTLRADVYDRPLLYPAFAEVFTPAVINVLPMTAAELETSVIGPAASVGVGLEPSLVTELVADAADQPGPLPLLQYALTELFERRQGGVLTLADYREVGGVRGALSRRAEGLYADLVGDQKHAAMQLFLRLVRLGHGTRDSRRRVPLRELDDLDMDPVDLSELLGRFGRHRLLSFDRDARTGEGTVELAHESLLSEWERFAGWIARHRAALQRHETLLVAVEEWEASGRHRDYLPTGRRLDEFAAWGREGVLQPTRREREFLDCGLRRRLQEQQENAVRAREQHRLEARARARLLALVAVIVLLGVATTFGLLRAGDAGPVRVALVYHGAGTELDHLVEGAFDRAVTDFDLVGTKQGTDQIDVADALRMLSESGQQLILESTIESRVDDVAPDFPDTRYAVANYVGDQPNVAYLTWAEHEGSFLVGVAAALTSRTGTIGFLGGVDTEVIRRFQAGYEAGARAARPGIHILSAYVSCPPDLDGFIDVEAGERAARTLYGDGADVVFHAAGAAGLGTFEAAADLSGGANGHLWAIGVDSDQYETTRDLEGTLGAQRWRPHILTSMVKHLEVGFSAVVGDFARGEFTPGPREFGLAEGGIDISYSGGFIDQLRPQIEAYRADIIAGEIRVPDR
ncbi:MAG: BMP family ABC transporter substrate-binding protein [Geodermatophilaceae bacterium]|nr:BMP family ABC transporter substrate-binding protein [Geodermatophilaceae bacterium]